MKRSLTCAVLAFTAPLLGASLANAPALVILACAAFWGAQARREWRVLRNARELENMEKRRQLRQRLLGGRA